MQCGAALEVTTTLDEREARKRLDRPVPVANGGVGSHHPLTIRRRDVDRRAAEGMTPLDADAIEMRVRHGDPVKPAAGTHRRDALVVDEAEAIP